MLDGKYEVIDAHCHIYPEKIAARAVAGTDRFYNTKAACDGTVAGLSNQTGVAKIDRFVVQSVATTPQQVKSINEFIAESVRNGGGRLTGLGTLHPESSDIEGDIEHLTELGLKGVKLHPDIQRFKVDDFRCLKIYEICEKKGLPMLIHTGDYRYDYSNPNRMLPIMKIYTGLVVVGAHLGGWSIWEKAAQQLCGIDGFYVDCSSSFPFLDRETAKRIIRSYGADKVLFGSDYPMWQPDKELEAFMSLGLTEDENRKILSENARKIYKIQE